MDEMIVVEGRNLPASIILHLIWIVVRGKGGNELGDGEKKGATLTRLAGIFWGALERRGRCGGRNGRHTSGEKFCGRIPSMLWRA